MNDLVRHALDYVEAIEAKERAESEAQARAAAERHHHEKGPIWKTITKMHPVLSGYGDFAEVDDLECDAAKRPIRAKVLIRLPECELIQVFLERSYWNRKEDRAEDTGWRLDFDDHQTYVRVYPNVEEWWDHNSDVYSDLMLAIAEAHRRYVRRIEREAREAATPPEPVEPLSLEERMVAALEDIASTLNGIANKYLD